MNAAALSILNNTVQEIVEHSPIGCKSVVPIFLWIFEIVESPYPKPSYELRE